MQAMPKTTKIGAQGGVGGGGFGDRQAWSAAGRGTGRRTQPQMTAITAPAASGRRRRRPPRSSDAEHAERRRPTERMISGQALVDEAVVDVVAFGVEGDQADDGEDAGHDARGERPLLEVELHLLSPTRRESPTRKTAAR